MSSIQAPKAVLKTAGDAPKIAILLAIEPGRILKTAGDPPNIAILPAVGPSRGQVGVLEDKMRSEIGPKNE